MTRTEMLEALSYSNNQNCREIAIGLLNGSLDFENEKKFCGMFMTAVIDGDYKEAIRNADAPNCIALTIYLVKNNPQATWLELLKQRMVIIGVMPDMKFEMN